MILKGPAIAGFAGQIHAPAERHVIALCAQFTPDQRSILEAALRSQLAAPANTGGQRGGVAAILATHADAVGCIGNLKRGNAEPRDAYGVSCAAVGIDREWAHRTKVLHPGPVQQRDFLVQRHLFHHHAGALIGR